MHKTNMGVNVRALGVVFELLKYEKSGKKGHPVVFFGPYYSVVLIELTFFLTKYVYDSIGFFMNNLKK